MDKPEYFECQCSTPEHTLRFWFEGDEEYPCVYASVFLDEPPLHRRLWLALKYVLGYKSRYGHFTEFILRSEDADRLISVAEALKKAKNA